MTVEAKQSSFNNFISTVNYRNGSSRTHKFISNLKTNNTHLRKEQLHSANKVTGDDSRIANMLALTYSTYQRKNSLH